MSYDALLWARARDLLFELEGGLAEHPSDPGGISKYGVSLRSYPHLGRDGIINLTREQATVIMRQDYWDPLPALPAGVRWFAFDSAFHSGASRALAWVDPPDLVSAAAKRLAFLASLSTWPTFGRGWARRVARVLDGIAAFEREFGREGAATEVVLHDWAWADRLHGVFQNPIECRGRFVSRVRGAKLDVRRE